MSKHSKLLSLQELNNEVRATKDPLTLGTIISQFTIDTKTQLGSFFRSVGKRNNTIRRDPIPSACGSGDRERTSDGFPKSKYLANLRSQMEQRQINEKRKRERRNARRAKNPAANSAVQPQQMVSSQRPINDETSVYIVLNEAQQADPTLVGLECSLTLTSDSWNPHDKDTFFAAMGHTETRPSPVVDSVPDHETQVGASEDTVPTSGSFVQTESASTSAAVEALLDTSPVSVPEAVESTDAFGETELVKDEANLETNDNSEARVLLEDVTTLYKQLKSQWGNSSITEICAYLSAPDFGDDVVLIRQGREDISRLSILMEELATAVFEDECQHHHIQNAPHRNLLTAFAISECLGCESDEARSLDLQAEIGRLIETSSSVYAFMSEDASEPDSHDGLRDLISSSVMQGLWLRYIMKRFPVLDGSNSTLITSHPQMRDKWEVQVKRVFDCAEETLQTVAQQAQNMGDARKASPKISMMLRQLITATETLRKLHDLGTSGDFDYSGGEKLNMGKLGNHIPAADIVTFEEMGHTTEDQGRLRAIASSLRFAGPNDALQIRVSTFPIPFSDELNTSEPDPERTEAPIVVCHRIGGPAALPGNMLPIRAFLPPSFVETARNLKQAAESGLVFWIHEMKESDEGELNFNTLGSDGAIVCERNEAGFKYPHFVAESIHEKTQLPIGMKETGRKFNGYGNIDGCLDLFGVRPENAYSLVGFEADEDSEDGQVEGHESTRKYVYRILKSVNHWSLDEVYTILTKAGFTVGLSQRSHPDAVRASSGAMYTLPPAEVHEGFIKNDKICEALDLASDADLELLAEWLEEEASRGLVPNLSRTKRKRKVNQVPAMAE